jgi:hypothetical protein
MTWIKNEYQLSCRQLVAYFNAPNETKAGQQQLAAESLSQLQIRSVVAYRSSPRVINFECACVYYYK